MARRRGQTPQGTQREYHRRQRQREALEYRLQGASYRDIAEAMKISVQTAWAYVQDALKEVTAEPAAEVRTLQLQRYDQLLLAQLPLALRGDPAACQQTLAIMDRINTLHGVKAPSTDGDATQQARSLLSQLLQTSIAALGDTGDQPGKE